MKSFIILLFLSFSYCSFGQQLVYKPINPAFGGDTFNYQWLLNSANSQNQFEDSKLGGFKGLENLNRGLDGRFGRGFGMDDLPPNGTSMSGDFQYEVFQSTDGLVINILNIVTGEASQIIIPN